MTVYKYYDGYFFLIVLSFVLELKLDSLRGDRGGRRFFVSSTAINVTMDGSKEQTLIVMLEWILAGEVTISHHF